MIHRSTQIGNVEDVCIVEMGNGDVKVSDFHQPDDKYTGVMFYDDSPKEIGSSEGNHAGLSTNEVEPDVMLTFTKIESIEVVEDALRRAKIRLKGILTKENKEQTK